MLLWLPDGPPCCVVSPGDDVDVVAALKSSDKPPVLLHAERGSESLAAALISNGFVLGIFKLRL